MTDRELLEAAARAIGKRYFEGLGLETDPEFNEYVRWNPLTDDGDALRLAVLLRIHLLMDGPDVQAPVVEAMANTGAEVEPFAIEALDTGDPYAATRRAIVRAAAAMADKEKA